MRAGPQGRGGTAASLAGGCMRARRRRLRLRARLAGAVAGGGGACLASTARRAGSRALGPGVDGLPRANVPAGAVVGLCAPSVVVSCVEYSDEEEEMKVTSDGGVRVVIHPALQVVSRLCQQPFFRFGSCSWPNTARDCFARPRLLGCDAHSAHPGDHTAPGTRPIQISICLHASVKTQTLLLSQKLICSHDKRNNVCC